MGTIKRLDRLEVSTTDLSDAAAVYQRNFNFRVSLAPDGKSAALSIGDAQISLLPASEAAGEGMSALWLEADNVDKMSAALERAGYSFKPIRTAGSRRILEVEPQASNQVPLFIFDRKG